MSIVDKIQCKIILLLTCVQTSAFQCVFKLRKFWILMSGFLCSRCTLTCVYSFSVCHWPLSLCFWAGPSGGGGQIPAGAQRFHSKPSRPAPDPTQPPGGKVAGGPLHQAARWTASEEGTRLFLLCAMAAWRGRTVASLWTALFWDISQRVGVIPDRRFGTTWTMHGLHVSNSSATVTVTLEGGGAGVVLQN